MREFIINFMRNDCGFSGEWSIKGMIKFGKLSLFDVVFCFIKDIKFSQHFVTLTVTYYWSIIVPNEFF